MDAREVTLTALAAALAGEDVERALARALRAARLDGPGRAQAARRSLGAACLRGRLLHRLASAGLGASPAELLLAYLLLEERLPPPEAAAQAGLPADTAQRLAQAPPRWPEEPVARLAARGSLPGWLAELWLSEWGEAEAHALAEATNRPGPTTLRANLLRTDRDALARALASEGIATRPARLAQQGLIVEGRANLFGSQAWRSGLFEVQDEASQLVLEACAPRPGERWLDLCAGSGGKTLGLAALLGNQGELWAADIDPAKLDNLRARLRRSGAQAHVLRLEPGREAEGLGPECFDGVLVDAPCSELGVLRRHPGRRWTLRPDDLQALPPLQARLLALGRARLAPGGRLVYATCTLRQAENQGVAGGLASLTLLPHRHGTDGFFVAASDSAGLQVVQTRVFSTTLGTREVVGPAGS